MKPFYATVCLRTVVSRLDVMCSLRRAFLEPSCWRFLSQCRLLSPGIRIVRRFLLRWNELLCLLPCQVQRMLPAIPSRCRWRKLCIDCLTWLLDTVLIYSKAHLSKGVWLYDRFLKQWSWLLCTFCLTRDTLFNVQVELPVHVWGEVLQSHGVVRLIQCHMFKLIVVLLDDNFFNYLWNVKSKSQMLWFQLRQIIQKSIFRLKAMGFFGLGCRSLLILFLSFPISSSYCCYSTMLKFSGRSMFGLITSPGGSTRLLAKSLGLILLELIVSISNNQLSMSCSSSSCVDLSCLNSSFSPFLNGILERRSVQWFSFPLMY